MRRTRPSGAVVSLSVVGYASHRDDFEPSSSRTSCFQIVHRASTHRRRIFSLLPPTPCLSFSLYRLALYLHLVYFLSLSLSLSLCLSLSYIPFLPVIFITVLARSLAWVRARARAPVEHVAALAPHFKSSASSRRGCRRPRSSSRMSVFRVCARQRPMGNRTRVISRHSRGGATE